jgi:ribose 5-phosphate isomerase RpiB
MPVTENFAEQKMAILKHLQKELFNLVDTGDLSDSEEQTILIEMREIAQAVILALGLTVTGESEDGVISANIVLGELPEE